MVDERLNPNWGNELKAATNAAGEVVGVLKPQSDSARAPIVVATTDAVTGRIAYSINGVDLSALNPSFSASVGLPLVSTSDVAMWNTDKTAALTVAVDSSVLFNGLPTLKVTIPAGTTGACKVGTNIANTMIPTGWDRKNFALAVRYEGFTGYDYSSTFPPAVTAYFGDASYANFWSINNNLANIPETKPRDSEWVVFKPDTTGWAVGGGSPALAQNMRTKVQWTQVSQVTDCYLRIGFYGKMPARKLPTVIFTMDDGFASWDSFLKPLFKHYDIPVTMGIASSFVGQANYLTAAQIVALFNDPTKLFDIVNHGQDNTGYNALGAAGCLAQMTACRTYLQGIGITGDGPSHHPWVQSQYGNDIIDLAAAAGFLSARSSSMTAFQHGQDQALSSGQDKLRWSLNATGFLGSSLSLAQAKTLIDNAITANAAIIIGGHDFAAASSTYVWTYNDMIDLVDYAKTKVTAGTAIIKSWTRWYSDLTGRSTDRR